MAEQKTEVGITITNFKLRKDAGLLKIVSSPGASTSYMWFEPSWVQVMNNGKPEFIEGDPIMKCINRGSLETLLQQVDADQAVLDRTRTDISDVLAEMERLDTLAETERLNALSALSA